MVIKRPVNKSAYNSNWNAKDEQKKLEQVPLKNVPDKFKCIQCNKWKFTHQYSKNQLSTYQWKAASAGPNKVNGVTAQLKCRICVGEQATELLCQGPCGLIQGLDEFSKTQRKSPDTAWCYTCTQWREACEPEVAIQAHPNGILSTDEERELAGLSIGTNDLGGGYSDSDEEYDLEYTYTSMAALSIRDNPGKVGNYTPIAGIESGREISVGNTMSSQSNPYASLSEYTGHIGENDFQESKASRVGPSTGKESGNGWSVIDARRNPQNLGIRYNAFDSAGNVHSRIRMPSTSGSASNTQPTSSAIKAEQSSTTTVAPSGWIRPTGRKTPMPSFPSVSRPQNRRSDYDDDESEDEM